MSLFLLPQLFGTDIRASMLAFIVFYGLDWVATVPPTLALCRQYFGARAPVVFGWVFASHQVGAALAAFGAGVIRDVTGSYDGAWYGAAALCMIAAALSISIRRRPSSPESALPVTPLPAAAAEAHG
jgi:predicted MFS family arabinose efflux permease